MKSLRWRLVSSLWLAVIVIGGVSAFFAYREAEMQAKDMLDDQLHQIAGFATANAVPASSRRGPDETIQVAVWDAAGKLTFATTPLLEKPLSPRMGFSAIVLMGEPYRMLTTRLNGRLVEIAQPLDTRDDLAESAAMAALFPLVILLPVLGIVIALVIRNLLKPVRAAAAFVSQRSALDVGGLQTNGLPTEIMPLVDEINRLLDRQHEAVEQQQQFLADAAHALRTPLAALQLQTDVLRDARTDEQRQARLDELREGLHRTSRLASQLLSIARVAAVRPEASQTAGTNLDEACQLAADALRPICRFRQVEIRISGTAGLHCVGSADQISVVLGNLLDNAIRYTQFGSTVLLTREQRGANVVLTIDDCGPGLPHDELTRVFARFYRAPGDQTEGSGLGLSIVESIVRALGGSVCLENRAGSGLRATVHVPSVSQVDVEPRDHAI